MGVDPGLRITGWGVIEVNSNKLSGIACGIIKTNKNDSISCRLNVIYENLLNYINLYKPIECAIEETFVNKNPISALKLGHARAAAMLSIAQAGLEVSEYAPNKVKKAVVGVGHADKNQIKSMIKLLLNGIKVNSNDEADALAVAICHAHHRNSF
tara:strand:- start:92 stop:556 length:465 start_codon:yes stop_codon:yes gene_type:complete